MGAQAQARRRRARAFRSRRAGRQSRVRPAEVTGHDGTRAYRRRGVDGPPVRRLRGDPGRRDGRRHADQRHHRRRLPPGVTMAPLLIAGPCSSLFAGRVHRVPRTVRIVPQARARNVERLGRYSRTLQPGLNFVIPYIDRVYPAIDLREQVVSFQPQPVITEDNLVVEIDTVLYFQVTDPRAAAYEIASYLQARRAAHRHDAAQRRRLHGPGEDAHLPRHHQQPAARRAGRRHRQVGAAGQPGGDQGDRPAEDHQGRDGEADARRTRQARRHPQRRRSAPVADPHRRGRQAGRRAAGRRQPGRSDPQGRGPVPRDRPGLPGRAPQRPGPETARLPVPADAAQARAGGRATRSG